MVELILVLLFSFWVTIYTALLWFFAMSNPGRLMMLYFYLAVGGNKFKMILFDAILAICVTLWPIGSLVGFWLMRRYKSK